MNESKTNRVGIEKITAYPSTLALDMKDLAIARGVDIKHPLEELLVTSRSMNPVWEDPVTMAVNAAMEIVDDEDRQKIELIVVGTGVNGLMEPVGGLEEALSEKGIEFVSLPNPEAIEIFNKLSSEKRIGACFHLTC